MATIPSKQPSKFQTELQQAADGLTSSNLSLLNSLVILGVTLSKAEIISKLKAYVVLFTTVTQAKLAYAAAVSARKAVLADMHAFYQSLAEVLKQTLGPTNQGLLPGFGIAPPKERTGASPEVKALAKVKAAATRKARGTMSKKQKLAIKPSTNVTLQVLGSDGTPYDASAPSVAPAPITPGGSTPSTSTAPISPSSSTSKP